MLLFYGEFGRIGATKPKKVKVSYIMRVWVTLFWADMLTAAADRVFVDALAKETHADGSESAPFASLTSALQSQSEYLEIELLPHASPITYQFFPTFSRTFTGINCANNTLYPIFMCIVQNYSALVLSDCSLTSDMRSLDMPLIIVYGRVDMTRVEIWGLAVKGVAVFGKLTVKQGKFWGNQDAVIASNSLGWEIEVTDSVFANNTSIVGTVFALHPSTASPRRTSLHVQNCVFLNNSASSEGSVLLFMENLYRTDVNLGEKEVVFEGCEFRGNPGYAFLLYLKEFKVELRRSVFTDSGYAFVLVDNGGSLQVSDSECHRSKGFFLSSQLLGSVTLRNITVSDTTEGPVILGRNEGQSPTGMYSIQNLTIVNPALKNKMYRSSTLFLITTNAEIKGLAVIGGSTYFSMAGTFGTGTFSISDVMVRNATAWAAGLISFFGSSATVRSLQATNCTLLTTAWVSLFMCEIQLSGLVISDVHTDFKTVGKYAYTVISMSNSFGNFSNVSVDLPNTPSTPVFYGQTSTMLLRYVWVSNLGGVLVAGYESSVVQVQCVKILRADTAGVFDFNMNSKADLQGIGIESGEFYNTFLSVDRSVVTLADVALSNITFASLMSSVRSTCSLSGIRLVNINSGVLFSRLITSQLTVSELSASGSTFDLVQITNGNGNFSHVSIINHRIRRRFIILKSSTLQMKKFTLYQASGELVGALLYSEENSVFSLTDSTLSDLYSEEQGLMLSSRSSVEIQFTSISVYNITFISAMDSSVIVDRSSISHGGRLNKDNQSRYLTTSGFLDCLRCNEVIIKNSSFFDLRGKNGGSVSVVNGNKKNSGTVLIYGSKFEGCRAEEDGGAGRFESVNVYLAFTELHHNTARRGGGVFISYIARNWNDSNTIAASTFAYNSATEGGAIKWIGQRPSLFENKAINNTAVYGPFEASEVSYLYINNSEGVTLPPGQRIPSPLLIELRDRLDQVIATDNSTVIELRVLSHTESVEFLGDIRVTARSGVANFSALMIRTPPLTNLSMGAVVVSSVSNASVTFTLLMRRCIPGEVTSNDGCYPCPKGSYSVNPTDSSCKHCPRVAICPGASSLVIKPDHWRASTLSDLIFQCTEQGICGGGEQSECGEGYTGRLCSACSKGYFTYGHVYCFRCRSRLVLGTSVFASSILPVLILFILVVCTVRKIQLHPRVVSLRIIIGMLHSVLIVSSISVGWKYHLSLLMVSIEIFQSLGLAAIPIACFDNSISWVYWKAIIASILPIALIAALFLVFSLYNFVTGHIRIFINAAKGSVVILYFLYVYVSKAALDLMVCRQVDNRTYWLHADMQQQCWTSDHFKFSKVLFIPMFVIFVLGYPVGLSCLYIKARSSKNLKIYRFLRGGVQSIKVEWEIWLTLRKTASMLVICSLSYTSTKIQILSALALMYLNLCLQLFFPPYNSRLHNSMETSVQIAAFLLCWISFYFQESLPLEYQLQEAIGITVFICILLFFAFLTVCVLKTKRKVPQAVQPHQQGSIHSSPSEGKLVVPVNSEQNQSCESGHCPELFNCQTKKY